MVVYAAFSEMMVLSSGLKWEGKPEGQVFLAWRWPLITLLCAN
jgi:hypothetical protein